MLIINLDINNKVILVIGGSTQAQKRIDSLLSNDCHIIVISDSVNPHIASLVKTNKISLEKLKIQDTKFIAKYNPDIIITTTSDKMINQKIINAAKKKKILVYSSDDPIDSDFANPAIIDFKNMIQIAVFTKGQSPAMSKKIKAKLVPVLEKIITKEDIAQIKLQKITRDMAKKLIPSVIERKTCLYSIMADNQIDQLIKDGQIKKAEKRALTILRNWK